MINGIQSAERVFNYTQGTSPKVSREPLTSFEKEDTAIISAEAKMLNELDKYNSGESNEINLAVTCIESKNQVAAAAKVIKTKSEMLDTLLDNF